MNDIKDVKPPIDVPDLWWLLGLLLLAHILLRGWGPWRYGHGWKHERWRRRFEEKFAAMTPEEREKVQEEWGCHRRAHAEKSDSTAT